MLKRTGHLIFITLLSTLLFACGGGGGGGAPAVNDSSGGSSAPATAATPALAFTAVKTFRFSWTDASDARFYRLLENADGASGFTQIGDDIAQGTQTTDLVVPLYRRINAQYILQSCNAVGCTDSATVSISGNLATSIGYVKASNTDGGWALWRKDGDQFGSSVSLSADGNTLAIGAFREDSKATGMDGEQTDNSAGESGAVYVFTRTGITWHQQAYVKASNTGGYYFFGYSLSLSADGNTLAVGAFQEDSKATGVDGEQTDNSADKSGAVYVFTRTGITWSQQAYVKASNTDEGDHFGQSLSLSADGNTLAVGADGEDSNVTGVGGDQTDNSVVNAGAVYMFTRTGITWSQQAYVKASNTGTNDSFGSSLNLSADGNTLAVGADGEGSNATGVGGNEKDNSATGAGAVYVFTRTGITWSQQAYLKASNTDAVDLFGYSLSLSADGNTLAVGVNREGSEATGVGGDQTDNSADNVGAVYLFTRNGIIWSQQAYVKASNTDAKDYFATSLSLSADGNTLAVGANREGSKATGVGGDQTDNSADNAGAVYLY